MKLRSIVLAGLLGSTLLMMSGCGSDDIKDFLKVNVIHVANANSTPGFTIEGNLKGEDQDVAQNKSKMFIVEGEDSYTVNNDAKDAPKDFKKDSAHLYALCENGTVITDSATGGEREIEILNLSSTPINALDGQTMAVKVYNGTNLLATMNLTGQTLDACTKELLPATTFNLSDVTKIDVNGVSYDVPAYDSDVADALDDLNDVDFDIVIFNAGAKKGTIIPLATPKEIKL